MGPPFANQILLNPLVTVITMQVAPHQPKRNDSVIKITTTIECTRGLAVLISLIALLAKLILET